MASIYKKSAETPRDRLLEYISDVPQEVNPIPEQWSEKEKKTFCRKEWLKMDHLRKKIISAVTSLQEINSEWTAYIHQINDEELRKKETASYVKNSREWILDAKDQGREAIDVLSSLMADLELRKRSYDDTPSNAAKEEMVAPTVVRTSIHLPTMGLPQFNGDLLKWPEFWARFQAEVGSQTIPKVTKLNYLLNCLVGAAKATASGYAIIPENYEVVVTVLQQRYGDENLIKKHLQSELKHLPTAQFKNLRPTIEKMEVILRQLETLGDNINHPQIELAIEEKLPKWLLLEIYTKKSADPFWSVKKLRNYIEEAVTLREMVDRYHGYSEAPNTNRSNQKDSKYQDNKRSSAMATIVRDKEPNVRKHPCVFCKGDHWNDDCQRYRSHKKRGERVKELGICYKCLYEGHYTKECRRKTQCFHCKERHNSALCRHKFSDEKEREGRKPNSSDVRRRDDPADKQESSDNVTLATAVTYPTERDETVLLLCREIFLQKDNGRNETVKATVFFDTGSQKSFITDDLVQQLHLKCLKEKEDIKIMGFGENKSKRYKSQVTEVDILLQHECLKRIKVNVVPFLTQKLRTTQVSKDEVVRWNNEYDVSISPRGTWKHPQILIGADYFYDFIYPSNLKKLACGFHLVNSSVGWMLTGRGILQEKHRNKQYHARPLIVSTVGVQKKEDDIDNYWKLELIGTRKVETKHHEDDSIINSDQTMLDEETSICPVIRQEQSNVHIQLLDSKRFSKWSKLVRVAAYVRRMADKMKGERNFPEKLTPEEIKRAEMMIIRQAQEEKIDDETKKKWSLIMEDDVWKCQGRMQNMEGPLPIYLPEGSRITHLYIKHTHEINGHSGISHTLAQLWKTAWVPKGRRTVTRIIKDCYGCKRWQAKPFKLPEMPPHPGIRVRRSQPFQSIGLDYLGPIQIKKSVEPIKRWIALFTCLTTRAVHLEVVQDLSAESFMQTFRIYISRRGKPEIILSDNATQFKLASKLFNDLSNMQTIRWKFITERAPWQGGLYERLVGLTKQTMRKAIGRRLLDEEELRTLVADAEGIINSRPITQVADDSNEVIRTMGVNFDIYCRNYRSRSITNDILPMQCIPNRILDIQDMQN